MEVHAEYFLKCKEAAKWLNTPQPVSGVPKEFLDGAHAVTTSFVGPCVRSTPCCPSQCPHPLATPCPPPADAPPPNSFATRGSADKRNNPSNPSPANVNPPRTTAAPGFSPARRASKSRSMLKPCKPNPPASSSATPAPASSTARPPANPCACPPLPTPPMRNAPETSGKPGPSKSDGNPGCSSGAGGSSDACGSSDDDPSLAALNRSFPSLASLSSCRSMPADKSLLFVPVELHEHFVFGVAVGCPFPPPEDVDPADWKPLVNRFVLDAGRKCCLMFSYFAEGTVVVSLESFNDVGDRLSEVNFFERTAVVGVFPRGLRARMQILEKRDCTSCTAMFRSCTCPVEKRAAGIAHDRMSRIRRPGHGPAHAGSRYQDENVTIHTYPYWAQVLDEYKWSRVGSYCVQIEYFEVNTPFSRRQARSRQLAYRTTVASEPRGIVDQMLRVSLYEKGVSALKPPATDVRWETASTVSVNSENQVRNEARPRSNVCFTDWHKLPGLQQDYLLVAPSNIVTGAHAREKLAATEAERAAARARNMAPVLPSWASGRAGVFEHILSSLEDLDEPAADDEYQSTRDHFENQLMRHSMGAARSVGTVMRPRGTATKPRSARRRSDGSPRSSFEEGRPRIASAIDSNRRRRGMREKERDKTPEMDGLKPPRSL